MLQIGSSSGARIGITDDGGLVTIGVDNTVGFSINPQGVMRMGRHRLDDLSFIMPRLPCPDDQGEPPAS